SNTLTKQGTGTLVLQQANTYSGGTNLTSGIIEIGTNTSLGTGTLTFVNPSTLRSGAAGLAITNPLSITEANGTIDPKGNIFTINGVISGNILNINSSTGTGTVFLQQANTYTGNELIQWHSRNWD